MLYREHHLERLAELTGGRLQASRIGYLLLVGDVEITRVVFHLLEGGFHFSSISGPRTGVEHCLEAIASLSNSKAV